MHLLVDSMGSKPCGSGKWLPEQHGMKTRRAWCKLNSGANAGSNWIVAATLTTRDVDDASQVEALLDGVTPPLVSLTAGGAYDQEGVYADVTARHPDAGVLMPPRSNAVPGDTAATTPSRRNRHLQDISGHDRIQQQKTSGYHWRALVETDTSRFRRVISDARRSRTDRRHTTELAIAVEVLNRMLELGCLSYVWVA